MNKNLQLSTIPSFLEQNFPLGIPEEDRTLKTQQVNLYHSECAQLASRCVH